jgi:hypothetical protein
MHWPLAGPPGLVGIANLPPQSQTGEAVLTETLAMSERSAAPGTDAPQAGPADRPVLRFVPLAIVALGLAFGYAMGWQHYLTLDYLAESRDLLKAQVAMHPTLAALVFFIVYVLATAFAFPAASALTIFGGFLFGWMTGSALVLVAATLGATLLFLAARSAFGEGLCHRVGGAGPVQGQRAHLRCGNRDRHRAGRHRLLLSRPGRRQRDYRSPCRRPLRHVPRPRHAGDHHRLFGAGACGGDGGCRKEAQVAGRTLSLLAESPF